MNSKIRVLHPITRMILGGAQLNTLYCCRLADRERFQTTLMTGPQLGPEGDLLSVARDEGVPTVVIPELRREIRPWMDMRAYRAMRSHLQESPYDIVHTHTSKAGILARMAAKVGSVRPVVIHTAHGWQWTPARNSMMNRIIIEAERRAALVTDRIVVVAEKDREKGLAAGVGTPDQYVMIESAIPLEEFEPTRVDGDSLRLELGIPPEAPVLGTVGRFAYQKAPELMMEAALRILEAYPDAHFIYVGDGPLRQDVVRQFGLEQGHPRLHLVGLQRDVPKFLAVMDVFLLSSRYEGLPRVVVEAMAMETPVVSTPVDGVVDVIRDGETGILVPFGDTGALSDAAGALLSDMTKARRIGAAARALVLPRFGVDRMVRRVEALYEEILSSRNRRPSLSP